jgi:hypothetical protein
MPEAQREQIAEGYECTVWQQAQVDGQTIRWAERRLVIRSLKQARRQAVTLRFSCSESANCYSGFESARPGEKVFPRGGTIAGGR